MGNVERVIYDIDLETHEVIEIGRFIIDSERRKEKKEDKYPFGVAMGNFKNTFKFVKTFVTAKPEFKTKSYRGYFYSLAPLLHYKTCALGKILHSGEFSPYSANDLMKELDIKKPTFYKFRKEAMEAGALARVQINGKDIYLVNPVYMTNGGIIDFLTYIVFSSDTNFMKEIPQEMRNFIEQEREFAELKNNVNILED